MVRFLYHKTARVLYVLYYVYLPSYPRRLISPLVKGTIFVIRNFNTFLSLLRMEVYIISGKYRGFNLKILFIGQHSRLSYVIQLSCLDSVDIERKGKINFWKVPDEIACFRRNTDLIIVETGWFFAKKAQRQGLLLIPEWIRFSVKTPDSVETIVREAGSSLRSDFRRIRKYGYYFETIRDEEMLKFFYHRMYIPYISKRHYKLLYTHKISIMEKCLRNGMLLFVKKEDETMGGCFLEFRDKKLRSLWLGIKDGKDEYLKNGVVGAIYYFTIKWAIKEGFTTIDFGRTRPFFNDGIFRYKKKWGTILEEDETNTIFYGIGVSRFSKGVRAFLEDHPFLFQKDKKLEGFVFVKNLSKEDYIDYILKNFWTDGLSGINIFDFNCSDEKFKKDIESKYQDLRFVDKDFVAVRHCFAN